MPKAKFSNPEKADVLKDISNALLKDNSAKARNLARSKYPFQFQEKEQRQIAPLQSVKLFLRDGFIDRYSGHRLVFPGLLRLVSKSMPEEFPYQRNWKMSECHIAYYELSPTIDHVMPIARGGADIESNWATTSMLRNSAKANWTLDELGWQLVPPGNLNNWDGLMLLYIELVESRPVFLQDKTLLNFYKLAQRALRA
jgi:5-methylcytosine-specific restriction endonuclease McrA